MIYDVIIIGKGPAGISTSLYARRSNLNVLVIGLDDSALLKAKVIDNYYGTPHIEGKELFQNGITQAMNLGVEIKTEEVISIKKTEFTKFEVTTLTNKYLSKTVVIASGTKRTLPDIANLKEYKDKNLSYCAVCDGFFYRGRTAYVLGDGTYAVSEALELEKNASEVVILTNGKDLTVTSDKIKVETRKIKAFKGEDRLSQIVFEDEDTINVPSLFIAWKSAGGYDFARKLGASIQNDKIEVNQKMETSIPGLYACGDVVGSPFQVAKAVYEGEIVGTSCSDYLKNTRNA